MATEYRIVSCGERDDVQEIVNELLEDGWELAGGLAHGSWKKDGAKWSAWAQAMTREVPHECGDVDADTVPREQYLGCSTLLCQKTALYDVCKVALEEISRESSGTGKAAKQIANNALAKCVEYQARYDAMPTYDKGGE